MYISLTNKPAPGDAAAEDAPAARPGVRTVSSTVITLGIVSMLTDISSESVSAILPLYLTGMLGLSTVAFGLLDGLYQGVRALVRIGAGYTSDRRSEERRVGKEGVSTCSSRW